MLCVLLCASTSLCLSSYGYDPLGLGKDKETVEKYRVNELIHARWAMLAAAGIIIPEGLEVRRGGQQSCCCIEWYFENKTSICVVLHHRPSGAGG